MEMKKDQIEKYQVIRKEVESLILKKLAAIKERVLTHNYPTLAENIETLVLVSDELDDVLLNWEMGKITGDFPEELDFDED